MTANNVLHSCTPGTKCAIKIAAPAFGSRLEAAPADLVEKHEPRGGVELKDRSGGGLTGKPQSEKDVIMRELGEQGMPVRRYRFRPHNVRAREINRRNAAGADRD